LRISGGVFAASVALALLAGNATLAADLAPDADHRAAAVTSQSSAYGRIVRPESDIERPGDVGRRMHTPLRVLIPDRPVVPPHPSGAHRPD
jgi:hypothetical protein